MGALLLANPRKRRKSKAKKKTTTRRRRNPIAKVTRRTRRRSNPRALGGAMNTVVGSAVGAGGALVVEAAMQRMPFISPAMSTGPMGAATRGVIALGAGMLVSKFLKQRKLGEQIAAGGLTVAMYSAAKDSQIGKAMGLSNYGGDLLGYGGGDGLLYYGADSDMTGGDLDYYSASETYDVPVDMF